MKTAKELIEHIELKQLDKTVFEGNSITVGSRTVFGGQVLAQALNAAYRTVSPERLCHSAHAYFLLPGDLQKPIHYKVQLVRDGGSFTTRYVVAEQNEKTIFVLAASFQIKEEGLEFQVEMPQVKQVDELLSWEEIYEQAKDFLPENVSRFLSLERPIIFKPTIINNPFEKKDLPAFQDIWFKFNEAPENLSVNHFHEMLAYASDYNILITALQPHASQAHFGNMQLASLDHALWFHHIPDDFSTWFLFHIEVSATNNARGLTEGKIFSQDGKLIASVVQEGLMRHLQKIEKEKSHKIQKI